MSFKILLAFVCILGSQTLINANVIKRDFSDEQFKNILEELNEIAIWAQLFNDELPVIFEEASESIKGQIAEEVKDIGHLVDATKDEIKTNYGDEGLKCVDPQEDNFTALKDDLVTGVNGCVLNTGELVNELTKGADRILAAVKDKAHKMQNAWEACGTDEKCRFEIIVDGNETSAALREELLVLDAAVTQFKEAGLQAQYNCAVDESWKAMIALQASLNAINDCLKDLEQEK